MPALPLGVNNGVITGYGTALPPTVITNDDLAKRMDTSDEWIRERTGILSRHVGGMTSDLSIQSARKAMEMADVDPSEIDGLVLATTTPDRTVPATSATVQNALGIRCGSFDVNAACSGFVYALVVAHGLLALGARKLLVIGTDTLARITDWEDRNTAILFADGSAAVVLEASERGGQLLSWNLDADGAAEQFLYCDIGGFIKMDGKEVFRRAVRIMTDSAEKSMSDAGLSSNDIAMVIPHQANIRIIKAACERLGIPEDRTATVLHYTGNTSSASIPLALVDALESGRINKGDNVLLVGFGAGMTAASAILKWGGQ